MTEFKHLPVMPVECLEGLEVKPNGTYLDCTVGGAGHSSLIAEKLENGMLVCLDKDETALEVSKQRLEKFGDKVKFFHCDFKDFKKAMEHFNIESFDGILIDLGVSSHQIDTASRGFSYMHDSRLDMRMDTSQELDAFFVVNNFSKQELAKIFWEYGEEKFANNIAKNIVIQREKNAIKTTFQLNEIISKSIPAKIKFAGGHPSKKVFQALRIFVNHELDGLYDCLISLARSLKKGGRIVVLSFHSLEDRIVKNAFQMLKTDCLCPPKMPICTCGHKKEIKLITKKPILASETELEQNSRSHSAKLRIAEKL